MDWMIAVGMAKSGQFTKEDIERSIRECSPNLDSRKAGHIEDYAKRTAAKAWEVPEVKEQAGTGSAGGSATGTGQRIESLKIWDGTEVLFFGTFDFFLRRMP